MCKHIMYTLFWIAYDVCSSINIYLGIKFIFAGEIIYPIFYWILFGFEKLQTFSNRCCCDEDCGLGCAEFFQLRTLYAVFFNPYSVRPPYDIYKLIQKRVILLLFIQSNTYFRSNMFTNPQISQLDAILAYVMFLSYIGFAIAVNQGVNKKHKKIEPLFLIAGYTLLSSLFILPSQNVGFSIGYFHYFLVAIEGVAFIIYVTDKPLLDFKLFVNNTIDSLLLSQKSIQKDDQIWYLQFMLPFSYVKILVMLILLLSFGINHLSKDLYGNIATLNVSEAISLINITLGIIFGSIYLAYYFRRFVSVFSQYKFIQLDNENDLLTTVKYLKETRTFPKNIQFRFARRTVSKSKTAQYLLLNCTDNHCKLSYELIFDINQKSKEKVFSNVQFTPKYLGILCEEHAKQFLETAVEMMKELKDQSFSLRLSSQLKLQIVSKRIYNGFIFTKLTKNLVEELKNEDKKLENMWQIFLQQKAIALQIAGFMVILSPYVTFSPQQILYDLYEI